MWKIGTVPTTTVSINEGKDHMSETKRILREIFQTCALISGLAAGISGAQLVTDKNESGPIVTTNDLSTEQKSLALAGIAFLVSAGAAVALKDKKNTPPTPGA
jgi:hypothetical protein